LKPVEQNNKFIKELEVQEEIPVQGMTSGFLNVYRSEVGRLFCWWVEWEFNMGFSGPKEVILCQYGKWYFKVSSKSPKMITF